MNRIPRLLLMAATALLAGCAGYVPYNPGLEQRVLRMDERTHELLDASRSHPIALAESRSYLSDSQSTLQWMHDDAVNSHAKGPTVDTVERLRAHFTALQARNKPLRRTDLLGAVGSTAELRWSQVRKRTAHEWREAHPSPPSTTSDDTPTTTDDTTKSKDDGKPDHGSHGNHDSGGRR